MDDQQNRGPGPAGLAGGDVASDDAVRARRRVVTGVTAAAATAAGGSLALAAAGRRSSPTTAGDAGTVPTSASSGGDLVSAGATVPTPEVDLPPGGLAEAPEADRVLARLRRTTFGVTPELLDAVRGAGWSAWVDEQLAPGPETPELEAALADLSTLAMTPQQRRQSLQDQGPRPDAEIVHAALLRAVGSPWQLREVLVDHWHDHFHASLDVGGVVLVKPDQDRAIRELALGDFATLLHRVIGGPAMLLALDNASSRHPTPNENLARELLELHTVGVDGGYDETDVADTARVLTGWSVDRETGAFRFRPDFHDTGPKTVLGWSTAGRSGTDGETEGRELLDHLAGQAATARNVTWRLAQRILADDPSPSAVDAGVDTWERTGGDLAEVVRTLLSPPVFDQAWAPKVSRPSEALATMLRRLGGHLPRGGGPRDEPPAVLRGLLAQLGQPMFRAPAPTGHPNVAAAWTSSHAVTSRWQIAAGICARADVVGVDLDGLSGGASTVAETAAALAERLWLRPPDDDELDQLVASTGSRGDAPVDVRTRTGLGGLVLATDVGFER